MYVHALASFQSCLETLHDEHDGPDYGLDYGC
jgi:hypothetical protein